jgi:aspartyl-tRNA(Asn)/glutamyl-tRNA(Gln) amidotransferase subunit A
VSRYGLVAYASSLDQIGTLARDVRDAALLLNCLAGVDPRDCTCAPVPVPDFKAALGKGVKGLRLALPREFFDGLDPEIKKVILEAARLLEQSGAILEEVSLPHIEYSLPAYYIIAPAEASSNLARYDGARYGHRAGGAADVMEMFKKTRREGFGAEVKRRIMIGTYALSSGYYEAYYLKAQKVRSLIKRDFDRALSGCDAILSPTTPTVAFSVGEKSQDPLQMYLADIYTVAVNLAGLPGLVVPCGFVDNLPVGMQLIGKPFDEATLLQVGDCWQSLTDYHRRMPHLKPCCPNA